MQTSFAGLPQNLVQNIIVPTSFFLAISTCSKINSSFYKFYRHAIASIHFNLHLHREKKKKADGSVQIEVYYPKFKNGEN